MNGWDSVPISKVPPCGTQDAREGPTGLTGFGLCPFKGSPLIKSVPGPAFLEDEAEDAREQHGSRRREADSLNERKSQVVV